MTSCWLKKNEQSVQEPTKFNNFQYFMLTYQLRLLSFLYRICNLPDSQFLIQGKSFSTHETSRKFHHVPRPTLTQFLEDLIPTLFECVVRIVEILYLCNVFNSIFRSVGLSVRADVYGIRISMKWFCLLRKLENLSDGISRQSFVSFSQVLAVLW